MIAELPLVNLGRVLTRRRDVVLVDDLSDYTRLTIRMNGAGITVRDTVLGSEIGAKVQFRVGSGQLLLSKIDARNGACRIVPEQCDGAIITGKFWAFDIDQRSLDPTFLDYLTKTQLFVDFCIRASEGTTNRRYLQEEAFLSQKFPLPPLDEQRRIVARIEALAARIAEARGLRREALAEAEELARSTISTTLEEIGECLPLKEVAEVICGQHLTPEDQAETGVPYITGPADFTEMVAVPSRFARIIKASSSPGDVLLTVKGAGVGKVNLAPNFQAVIGRQLFALRPRSERLNQTYLLLVLKDRLASIRDAITATTVPGIGRSDVERLKVPMIPLVEQRRIVAYLDDVAGGERRRTRRAAAYRARPRLSRRTVTRLRPLDASLQCYTATEESPGGRMLTDHLRQVFEQLAALPPQEQEAYAEQLEAELRQRERIAAQFADLRSAYLAALLEQADREIEAGQVEDLDELLRQP